MQRSGSQKALLVFSILKIIGAALGFIGAIMAIAAAGLIGVSSSQLTPNEMAQGIAATGFLSVVLLVSSVWGLLCGIFGIRAANDNQKIMIVWVFVLIGLILDVISLIMVFMNGAVSTSSIASGIASVAFSAVMFVICNNIKREAGK